MIQIESNRLSARFDLEDYARIESKSALASEVFGMARF